MFGTTDIVKQYNICARCTYNANTTALVDQDYFCEHPAFLSIKRFLSEKYEEVSSYYFLTHMCKFAYDAQYCPFYRISLWIRFWKCFGFYKDVPWKKQLQEVQW